MQTIYRNNNSDKLQHLIAVYEHQAVCYNYNAQHDQLGVGKPLTEESAKHIFGFLEGKTFSNSYGFKGIIPENILQFKTDDLFVVWFTPAQTKQLHFKDTLPVNSDYYPVPPLVWKLTPNNLSVFAVLQKPFSDNERLYQAPFLNVGSNGSVCMGSAKYRTTSTKYEKIIQKAEDAFFNSVFTHTNTDRLVEGNIVDLLQELQEKKIKAFPSDRLLKAKMSVSNLLS